MKLPYFMKKLRIARLLFQPIFLISLALHGVVLMLPAPFDLDKPKPPKKEQTVKITKLPATANTSAQVSPQASPKPTPESSPQQNQSDFLQPKPIRWEFASSSVSQQQEIPRQEQIKDKEKKHSIKRQKKSALTEEITPSPTNPQPSPTPTPTPLPSPIPTPTPTPTPSPTPSPSPSPSPTPSPTPTPSSSPSPTPSSSPTPPNNQPTRGYSSLFNESQDEIAFKAVLQQVKNEQKLKRFEDGDISKLTQPDKFQDENFQLKDAIKTTIEQPLSETNIVVSLNKQLEILGFKPLARIGNYGGGTIYKSHKAQVEGYLIIAPMTDNQIVIILSKTNPS